MKITVVTICLNEEKNIRKTMESVINQTYLDIEYLVIDGRSQDQTLNIVKELMNSDPRIKLISEKDTGLYNAMNKGISHATGRYINFMNAGDIFHDDKVIEKVVKSIEKQKNIDIFCGYSYVFKKNGRVGELRGKKSLNNKEMLRIYDAYWGCHQAIFAKADTIRNYYFDERFRIGADYDWFLRNLKDKRSIYLSDIPVCDYSGGGISDKKENAKICKMENEKILLRNYGWLFFILIKKILPFFNEIRNFFEIC